MKNMRKKKRNWMLNLVFIIMILYVVPQMFKLVDINTMTEGYGLISFFYSAMDILIFPIVFLGVVISIIDKTGITSKILKKKNIDLLTKTDEVISNSDYEDRIQPYYVEAYGYMITMFAMYVFIIILFFHMRFDMWVLIFFLLGTSVLAIVPYFKRDFMVIRDYKGSRNEAETVKLISIKPYVTFANAHFERYSSYYRNAALGRYVLEVIPINKKKECIMLMYLTEDEVKLLEENKTYEIEYLRNAEVIFKIDQFK